MNGLFTLLILKLFENSLIFFFKPLPLLVSLCKKNIILGNQH